MTARPQVGKGPWALGPGRREWEGNHGTGRYQRVRVESRLRPAGPLPSSVDVILQARERTSGDPQTLSAMELFGIPTCGCSPEE